ncbi:hypothetical protein OGAPHI_005444 [Ogataea philodendri]|uniref:Uncharacterized protein n=1 Tax=Ogataea philodendri TaxID=1378263 RepID=A0A9P8T1Z4_9ASCO|nr:uncharacterized protein OGAPHI_005444 [Ogataea philodendri]KAH3662196.1 hypothetical protein OGAPHI_005444 [Ogataea philodendri]
MQQNTNISGEITEYTSPMDPYTEYVGCPLLWPTISKMYMATDVKKVSTIVGRIPAMKAVMNSGSPFNQLMVGIRAVKYGS